MKKFQFSQFLFFLKIYALVLSLFLFFRGILFFVEIGRLNDGTFFQVLQAFFMGLRFDLVISGYLLSLPFVVFLIGKGLNIQNKIFKTTLFYLIFVPFTLAFFVSVADIPYFAQFFQRFSITAFEWMDTPGFIVKMVLQEAQNWLYVALLLFSAALFYIFLRRIFRNTSFEKPANIWSYTLTSLLFLALMLLTIRGRIDEKSPIRTGTAYFCNNAFLNQLGLNPNYTLLISWLDDRKESNQYLTLMDDAQAVKQVQNYLQIHNSDSLNPLSRSVYFQDSLNEKHNVVIVIMESMAARKMQRHGNPLNLTPFLDKIATQGYYFENCYAAGIHTFNGVAGVLFSAPALFRQHLLKSVPMKTCPGIATTLNQHGYSTIYFTTHDGQFDNVAGFLKHNGFEEIVEKSNYPSSQVKTTLGVPDGYMFEHAIPILNRLADKNKPFLSVFMTASDHPPYYVPPDFKSEQKDIRHQIIEYADASLEKFIRLASQESWFKNTIFVFVADHGAALTSTYDIALDHLHVPLLFYAPELIVEPKVFSEMAGQIDVYPSIMGLLKLPYHNETLGVNLFEEERPYIFCNNDDKYGVLNQEWFLIVKKDNATGLYNYRTQSTTDVAAQYPDTVKTMKTYAESNMQTFQYLARKIYH